jgi:AcrR family transcriptional regulator
MDTDQHNNNDLELKNRILNAAREQFYIYGFSKVTVDEIANKLGISKKTFYKFFPSKDELVLGVVRLTIKEMDSCCTGLMNRSDISFVEKLKQLMTFVALQYSKISRHLIEDLEKNAPLAWKEIADYRTQHIQGNFKQLLAEGIQQGVFRSDLKQELVLLIYSNVIRNVITPEILSQVPFTAAEVFETIIEIMFEGILTVETRKLYHPGH